VTIGKDGIVLKDKRKAFAREYPKDWNATQAAIRAGYSPKTAYSQGQRLLKNVEVQAEIALLTAVIAEKIEIEVEQIVAELCKIAFAPAEARVLNSDKIRALELLGRHKKMFTDRTEHIVSASGPPIEPEERKKWLQAELELLEQAEQAPSCLAIDVTATATDN